MSTFQVILMCIKSWIAVAIQGLIYNKIAIEIIHL